VAAATISALAHETIGHGLGCLAVGGRVGLLTSVQFRCLGGSALTDAAGPLGNLLAGVLALAALSLAHGKAAQGLRLLLLLVATVSLGWLGGYLVYSGALGVGDPASVASALSWPPAWRIAAALAGCAVYAVAGAPLSRAVRTIVAPGEPPALALRRVAAPLAAAALSAVIAGLLWRGDPSGSAVQGALAVGAAPLPFAYAVMRGARLGALDESAAPVARAWPWIVAGFGLFLAFAIVQGRGLGPLA
jgi:hypothetical protein